MPVTGEDGRKLGFTFTWRIEDFTLSLHKKKQTIDSPVFRIKEFQNTNWKLMLYFPGDDEENITLNLCRCENAEDDPYSIEINGKLFVTKNDGSYIFLSKFGYTFYLRYNKYDEPLTIAPKTVLKDRDTFLFGDTLTVGFQFFVSSEASLLADVPVECYARSKLLLTEYSNLLPLKFPAKSSNYEYSVLSPIASTSTEHPVFQIELHCYDYNKNENAVSITIHLVKSDVKGFLKCKLSFLNKEVTKYTSTTYYPFEPGMNSHIWRVDISKETFHNYSISSATCLKCELIASAGKFISYLENTIFKQEIPAIRNADNSFGASFLQSNLMEMYDKKILCDFRVIVSGREFAVHKTVLSAVSPVFRAMFESGMTETEKSQVTIEEFSIEAVEKMLEFSYSDSVKDLKWNSTLELYSIADKYQIRKLKTDCSSFLESALSFHTVPDLLTIADLHDDTHLRKVAEDFIRDNSKAVFHSDAWKHFMKNNVQVASETMYRICKMYSEINTNLPK